MNTPSLPSCSSLSHSRFAPLFFGSLIGLGLGLATQNVGVGLAVGVTFFLVRRAQLRAK